MGCHGREMRVRVPDDGGLEGKVFRDGGGHEEIRGRRRGGGRQEIMNAMRGGSIPG